MKKIKAYRGPSVKKMYPSTFLAWSELVPVGLIWLETFLLARQPHQLAEKSNHPLGN